LSLSCISCSSEKTFLIYKNSFREYLECSFCHLIFVPRGQLISSDEEKTRYDSHENSAEDPRYRDYLTGIFNGINPHLVPGSSGLDFGCGASTLLAQIFEQNYFKMSSYDLYYLPDEEIWKKKYDFLVLSEVIEHFREPKQTMEKLSGLLKPQGQIFIKTKFFEQGREKFGTWFYKNDPTHIQFFNHLSLNYLAKCLKMNGPTSLEKMDLYRLWS